jgi:S1-C subfamily serine protease
MKTPASFASLVLLTIWLLWLRQDAFGAEPGEDLFVAVESRTASDRHLEQRLAPALQRLGKTLILERTRGLKEMGIYETAARAVVLGVTNEGFGSGVILNGQGHVLTNWHVVRSQPQVIVVFKPKDSTELKKELAYRAMVAKIDQMADLAILQISTPPKTMMSVPLGDVAKLAVGQDVHAIGHPAGEVWTYTKGIISQIRANYGWSGEDGREHRAKVIQTQTPINPGNSGGPLLDDQARLIGINSFRRTGEGLNYAVAVDEIQAFLQRQESRISPPPSRSEPPKRKDQCPDACETKGQGWTDIVGCFLFASTPPPDFWLIYRAPDQPPAYAAQDSHIRGQIDTVIKSGSQRSRLCAILDERGR